MGSLVGSLEERKTIIINGVPVTVGRNLAAALDRLQSTHGYKIWVDAVCINQDDVDERNVQIMRIRDIFSQSSVVTIWLGEDEMSDIGLNSWVENSFDEFRRCNTILEAHGRRTLEAALGVDVSVFPVKAPLQLWALNPQQVDAPIFSFSGQPFTKDRAHRKLNDLLQSNRSDPRDYTLYSFRKGAA
jgi:hypothetical protein